MNGKEKAVKMKADIEKKKTALASLQTLNGKTPTNMTKAERDAYDLAIGQLLSVLDISGKVNVN